MRLRTYWQASKDDAWQLVSDEHIEPVSPGVYGNFKCPPESDDGRIGNSCFELVAESGERPMNDGTVDNFSGKVAAMREP